MIEQDNLLSNPFPGLRPFETHENFLFFGRDGQSEEVLNRLRESRFVAVVGTSGSGKSSLVRAGVLPALYSGHMTSAGSNWRIAVFRPGNDPIGNLAQALNAADVFGNPAEEEDAALRLMNTETTLRRSSLGLIEIVSLARMLPRENLLILVDQFEELFRFQQGTAGGSQEDEAAAFVKLLLEPARHRELPIYVILTMRSDYLGETARFWGLPEMINEGQYLIPRMTDDGWREAITGPLAIAGATITVPLVNRLLNDAGDDPSQLPILQHALMRTWSYWKKNARESDPLDITHYEAVGGMSHALSRHADEAYEELFDPQQPRGGTFQGIAEKLFKRLTEKGADNREVRHPATVREVCEIAGAGIDEVMTVIKSYRREGRSFLMPPPNVRLTTDTLIDISHESLIRGWQRLREWANEESQSARIYRRLAETAVLHERDEAGLWRDPDLQLALKWREETKPNKAWAGRYHTEFDKAMAFLDLSLANREREAAERERQIERELKQAQALAVERGRRVRQQRWGLVMLSVLLLLLLGLTAFAFQQRSSALTQQRIAEQALRFNQAITAEADRQRNIARDELDRRVLAEQAGQAADEARNETQERLARTLKDAAARAEADAKKQQAIAAQAQAARAEAVRHRISADDAKADAEKRRDEANAALTEAREQKETAEEALKTIREIDVSAPYFHAIMRGHKNRVRYAAFSSDGKNVMTLGEDARLWDANTGAFKFKFDTGGGLLAGLLGWASLSSDGKRVVVSNIFSRARVWDAETGNPFFDLQLKGGFSIYSPDNSRILSFNGEDNSWHILDAQNGHKLAQLEERNDLLLGIIMPAFSPNGEYVVTGSGNVAQIWEAATGKKVVSLSGHTEVLNSVAFSHDGRSVVTTSDDDTARVWNAKTGNLSFNLIGHQRRVSSAVFSADDQYVVTASEDGTARVWYVSKRNPVISGTRGGSRESGEHREVRASTVTELRGHDGKVNQAIFSPDDKWVVTIGEDKTARVWQATEEERGVKPGEVLAVLSGHIRPLNWVAFRAGDNRKFVITGSEDGTARVWDLTGLNDLKGFAATLSAERPRYEGDCPTTIRFNGDITTSEGSGKLKYKFVYSDGRASDVEEMTFDRPGKKQIGKTLTIATSSPQSAGEWVAIEILEPERKRSERASFTVKCLNRAQNQGAVARVTEQVLAQIMPNLPADERARYLPYLQQAMAEFDINTPQRQAAFLAQLAHESAELHSFDRSAAGKANAGRIALGNTQTGVGSRFKGRSAIEITGRANYQKLGQLLGLDLVGKPELAATPEVAFRLVGIYWKSSGLNELADRHDLKSITIRIAGSYSRTLADRLKYYDRAKDALGVGPAETTQPQ